MQQNSKAIISFISNAVIHPFITDAINKRPSNNHPETSCKKRIKQRPQLQCFESHLD